MMQMLKRKRLMLALVPVLLLLGAGQRAGAATLVPGDTTVTPDSLVLTGTETVLAYGTTTFTGATFSGTLTYAVIDEGSANGLGGLTFIYQMSNDSGSLTALEREVDSSFLGFQTDVYFAENGSALSFYGFVDSTLDPNNATRDASGIGVGFDFTLTPITAGNVSAVKIIRTDAPTYTLGFTDVIDSGIAEVTTFQPAVGSTPEPATLLLFGTGLLGVGAAIRRRRGQHN